MLASLYAYPVAHHNIFLHKSYSARA